MNDPPRILAVDDSPANLDIVRMRLEAQGYDIVSAMDGEAALVCARETRPDLIILDVMMPKLDGIEVLGQLKRDPDLRAIPVVLLTAKADAKDVVAGLEAGADDYLVKPFQHAALVARVKSLLRLKSLHDTVVDQAAALQRQTRELVEWNRSLEDRVASQMAEIERVAHLERFLAPHVAALVGSGQGLLESHRREVTVVFCDLRGFTAFTDTSEPEDVMGVLRDYHRTVGEVIFRYEGALERFAGDGMLILFNDPVPCEDHPKRAVGMAIDIRDRVETLARQWAKRGHTLGFGVGIAMGYATLGQVGFERRHEYAAVGSVTNLASRLCDEARPGQIVVSQRVQSFVEAWIESEPVGDLSLKGFSRTVPAHNILGWRAGKRDRDP